ncbi:hypothetical protein GCM10010329_34410 [Streptomyces spiroverticillatus]|uniref:Uncharacterized protein n=1 Tax=Streptomyces finlayi TaxID=67296 RepID=A0A918WX51_9ACTN|nr:hypothetical protein [Streptomyces finlayi]GHA08741.1 hypothetical protein GCM10010329_34410 [Streptomyces spiroverticillatus]GHC91617.1 hypothetical protein GCM10010334_26820 [Streptomyces finlayi]
MSSYSAPFPEDLIDLQQQLHQAQADFHTLATAPPWGADSAPVFTEEEVDQVEELWERIRELTMAVNEHPYWTATAGGPGGPVNNARRGLRVVRDPDADAGAA